jgi:hypothetical protein
VLPLHVDRPLLIAMAGGLPSRIITKPAGYALCSEVQPSTAYSIE